MAPLIGLIQTIFNFMDEQTKKQIIESLDLKDLPAEAQVRVINRLELFLEKRVTLRLMTELIADGKIEKDKVLTDQELDDLTKKIDKEKLTRLIQEESVAGIEEFVNQHH